jgi:hypothetical protein
MAETAHEDQTQTVKQPQFTTNVTTLCCESCVVVKDKLIQVFEELKSTRTIIALLQEDIVKPNANHESKSSQREQSFVHDQVSKNWKPALKNGYKKCKKPEVSKERLYNEWRNMAASDGVARDSVISVSDGGGRLTSRKCRCSRRQYIWREARLKVR